MEKPVIEQYPAFFEQIRSIVARRMDRYMQVVEDEVRSLENDVRLGRLGGLSSMMEAWQDGFSYQSEGDDPDPVDGWASLSDLDDLTEGIYLAEDVTWNRERLGEFMDLVLKTEKGRERFVDFIREVCSDGRISESCSGIERQAERDGLASERGQDLVRRAHAAMIQRSRLARGLESSES